MQDQTSILIALYDLVTSVLFQNGRILKRNGYIMQSSYRFSWI